MRAKHPAAMIDSRLLYQGTYACEASGSNDRLAVFVSGHDLSRVERELNKPGL
jgi:hypothetical protein